jgi:hypothetical protein
VSPAGDDPLERARALLARVKGSVSETKPSSSPGSYGASDGVGFDIGDEPVHVDVYVFDDAASAASAASAARREAGDDSGTYRVHGSNGPLMIVGETSLDGPDGTKRKYALADIASAFAGRE